VLDLVKAGRHLGITCYYHEKYNIKYMMHEHSRKRGLLNKSHAIMAGGIRRHPVDDDEIDVIIDGLNLGRAMSFKNVAGKLPFGGCKATVQMAPLDIDNMEIMGFLAFAMDSCRNMTGPDMNFPTEMADVMSRESFSSQFTGGPSVKTGETGAPTAYGVYLTLKQAVKFNERTENLEGKSAVLVGLGAVGRHLGEYLLKEKVRLYVADIDKNAVDSFIKEHPAATATELKGAYEKEVDIICPCANGGIFSEENIPKLNCKYIWGAANNQLKASSQEEEIRLAKLIAQRGILFQTEWWHNTAGVICGAEEYLYDGTPESLAAKIENIMPSNTRNNLNRAKELGITPTENAYRTCEEIIYD
jgi:glutamate dehydrogenase/leucine dehydrogenase